MTTWTDYSANGDVIVASDPLTNPEIIDNQGQLIPFSPVIIVEDWTGRTADLEPLTPAERRFIKRNSAVYIGFINLCPRLSNTTIAGLGITITPPDTSLTLLPSIAAKAVQYGLGCDIVLKNSTPDTAYTWHTHYYSTPAAALAEAKRYFEKAILPGLDEILKRPTNRSGDLICDELIEGTE
jgi:hypothetical protein